MSGLSPNQRKLLDFVDTFIAQHGVSPSYLDIQKALSLRSKASVSRYLTTLKDRGHIDYLPRRARSITVLFPSEGTPNWESVARALFLQNRELRAMLEKLGQPAPIPEVTLPETKRGKRNV
jgi:SOS-response transcriptional repressor LexA